MLNFCAECRNLFIVMLNVIMLSVVMLNVVILNVAMLSVMAPVIGIGVFSHIKRQRATATHRKL